MTAGGRGGRASAVLVVVAGALAAACLAGEGVGAERAHQAAAAEASPRFDGRFWEHWGDGRAEIAAYDLATPRYGAERRGTAVAIFVTEPFADAARVKSDAAAGPGVFQAIKLNLMQDFPTGIYDYHLMTSAFATLEPLPGRDGGPGLPAGSPVKVSFSAQEWCGHAYQQALFRADRVEQTLHSYFEGEADAETTLPARAGGLSEDALLLWARGLAYPAVERGRTAVVPLLTGLERARLAHVEAGWEEAELSRSEETREIEVPAGRFEVEEARVLVRGPEGERGWTFQVEVAPPHRIVAWRSSEGERAELRGSDRLAYWRLNGPEGAAYLERLGLRPPAGAP